MDLGIKELGITFMVGAFTILGLELILYYFFNIQLTGFFRGKLGLEEEKPNNEENAQIDKGKNIAKKDESEDKDETMKTAVFIGLAFAIGILAEDLSYKYIESLHTPFKTIPATVLPDDLISSLDLPSRYDSRVKVLVYGLNTEKPDPQWLARDLARTDAFTLADPELGPKVDKWIKDPNRCKLGDTSVDCPSLKEVTDSISRLYYFAKNRVYADPQYYDEMRKIQTRQEFSRAIAMIALIYFIIALVMVVPLLGLSFLKRNSSSSKRNLEKMHIKVPVVLLILYFVFFFSIWAYERETDEFNKRAFGYFSSMQIAEKSKEPEKSQQPENQTQ